MYGSGSRADVFCNTPKLFEDDIITHTVLSVKGQLDANRLETANLENFFSHVVDKRTTQKVDGNLTNVELVFHNIYHCTLYSNFSVKMCLFCHLG